MIQVQVMQGNKVEDSQLIKEGNKVEDNQLIKELVRITKNITFIIISVVEISMKMFKTKIHSFPIMLLN